MDQATRLLLAARVGDRDALASWVRTSQVEVWRLCAGLVSPADADDLTQETFVRAMGAMRAFRGDASSRTWLLSIARRVCADAIRTRARRRLLARRVHEREAVHDPVNAEVDDLLARLDPDRRSAFVLTQLLGLSYAEAAEVCACPVGTIRSRVARAREDLLSALSERRDGGAATG